MRVYSISALTFSVKARNLGNIMFHTPAHKFCAPAPSIPYTIPLKDDSTNATKSINTKPYAVVLQNTVPTHRTITALDC